MEQGRQAAEAARSKGAIWGSTVQRLGEIPGEAIQQHQVTKAREQQLAMGAEQLRSMQDERLDNTLTAKSVAANTSTDPATGHKVWNHQGVFDDLMGQGRAKAAERYLKFGSDIEEHFGKIQTQYLATEHAKQQMRRDVLGGIMEAPEAERPGLYATTMGTLAPFLKDDPIMKGLPPVYDPAAVKSAYDLHTTEEQRMAARKEAAAEAKEGRFTATYGEKVFQAGKPGEKPTLLAEGAQDPFKGVFPVPPGGTIAKFDPTTGGTTTIATGAPKDENEFQTFKESYPKSIGRASWAAMTPQEQVKANAAFTQSKQDPAMAGIAREMAQERLAGMVAKREEGSQKQTKLEQQYRTVLQRAMSSRSGGIGLEDAKVQQANHLLALLDQTYDPKTGTHNIPKVLQGELSAGLARLVAPGGSVGIEMMREFDTRTAKGDLAGALTYITGTPFPTATQDITKMLKDSIQRQGKVALENREGEMRYLRGLAPTELDEERRQQLEKTSLNPLRLSRVLQNPKTGERKLQVSIDGGETWK